MDDMQEWEVMELYDFIGYADYASWEQTRMLLSCYVDHKKIHKMSDIMKFPWDNDNKTDHDTEITNDEIGKLEKMAQNYLNAMKNKNT